MNRTLKLFAAVTLIALTTAACQKEKLFDSQTAGEETVTFTVQTDAAATKATADNDGDGAGLTRCLVAVYMKTGDSSYQLYDKPAATGSGLSYTFKVNLIRKQTYQIVVWADKGATFYQVNPELTSVTRNTGVDVCNSDSYDAFYASTEFTQGTTTSTTITATRPFAQLNLITKDLNENFQPGAVSVTYSSPQSFNPFDGSVSNMTEVIYKADSPYYNPTTVTTATQHTLVMNYLFAAAGDQTILPSVKMTAKLTVDAEIEVANVPVKRNYRTNIIGNLLTEQTDFTITVEPDWSTPESDYIFVAPGVRQFVDNEYEIYAKEGLDWLAKTVNGGNTLSGKTVKLSADLDMTGIDYVPAGNTIAGYSSRTFAGVFDGQGHTISNLSVASHTGVYSAAGLFGTITGTVKNVKLANVNISSDHYAGGVVGYISANTGASVQNCSVEGGSIKSTAHLMDDGSYDDGDKAGGIVGYITAVDYVDGCSVKNLTITAYRDLGAIVGCAAGSGTVKVTNCTVGDNVLVVVDNSHNCEGFTTNEEHNAGNFVGRKLTSVDETGSTGEAQIVYPEANAVATVNGTSYATLAEAVAAVTDGSKLMILEPQDFSSASSSLQFGAGKSVTVMGAGEGSVIDASAKSSFVECSGDITFVNMTFKFDPGNAYHYNIGLHNRGGTHVYENCKFEGQTVAWGNTTYTNCEFTSSVKYAAFVYSGTVVYNNCKFSGVDRAVKVFDEGPALDVTYNNCTFSCQSPNKAAVEVDVTNNTTNLVKVAINNPVLEGTFGQAEHWGNEYFNLEGGNGCNGIVTIDGITYAKVATQNAFNEAVNAASGDVTVILTPENYTLPTTNLAGRSIILEGSDASTTVIDMSAGDTPQYGYKSVTFKNVTVKRKSGPFGGLSHCGEEHYVDSKVEGTLVTYAPVFTAKNTKFYQTSPDNYNIHIYEEGSVNLENCKFYCEGKSIYAHHDTAASEYSISIKGCEFSANHTVLGKAAIQLHTEYGIHGTLDITSCTATGFDTSINGGLWNELNNQTGVVTNNFVKTVNGVQQN